MTDQHCAFYLSLVLVILNTVETELPDRSARRNRVAGVNKEVSRVVDFFRPFAWGKEDLDKACMVIDRIDVLVNEFYPDTENADHQIEYVI